MGNLKTAKQVLYNSKLVYFTKSSIRVNPLFVELLLSIYPPLFFKPSAHKFLFDVKIIYYL